MLKQAMSEQGMSQAELAARIGKGKSSVSQYLSGKNIPRDDVRKKIGEVLGCNFDQVEIGDCEQKNISVKECARMLGKSEQFVRVALQTGAAGFGIAVKRKIKYDYHISPKKLNEYINT